MRLRLLCLGLLAAGCNDFSTAFEKCVEAGGCKNPNDALAIAPQTTTLAVGNSVTFVATGGVAPYVFSLVSGEGAIDPTAGTFTAATTTGTARVRVTDKTGTTADAEVTINPALALSPTNATLAVGNAVTFTASGGVAPYQFSLASGAGSVAATTGVFTASGSAGAAVVRVTDALGNAATSDVTVNPALTITPVTATLAIGNSVTFSAAGGVGPYSFSVVSGGGVIDMLTGRYDAPGFVSAPVVRVTDALGNTADANVTVNAALTISPSTATLAVGNSATFSATAGVPPYQYSVSSGGGTVDASSGLYTAPSTAGAAVVRVTDALGNTSDANVMVNPALAISPPSAALAVGNTLMFSTSGGVAPFTYGIQSGGGMVSASSGLFTAPNVPGTTTVRVTDARANFAEATVTINSGLTISPPTRALAVGNSFTFTATGGITPYTFSVETFGGGTINPASGLYTAPSSPGSAVVRVTDSVGNTSDSNVTVNPALAISPATATVAIGASFAFGATGGVPPYTFSRLSGSGTVTASGGYTAPSVAGSAVVRVTDSVGNTSNASVTVPALFAAGVHYAAGSSPQSLVTGDWNGDGKLDLAAGNRLSNNVSVFLGVGDGTFQAAVNVAVGTNPFAVTASDWNGDGKLDLATANSGSSNVSILLGVGNGTFQPAVNYATGSAPLSVAAGDWNRDGKQDLVAAASNAGAVSVLLGVGDGTFLAAVNYATAGNPRNVTVGDWNIDGKADLAVATYDTNRVSVLLGVGDGTFSTAVNYGTGTSPQVLTSHDLNGDGRLDLAVMNSGGNNLSVLLGVGDGTFQTAVTWPTAVLPLGVVARDWNGDGKADLVVACEFTNDVSILLGTGNGTFLPTVNHAVVGAMGPTGLAEGDFNGDGTTDVATANQVSNTVTILLASPQALASFALAPPVNTAVVGPACVTAADWNNDGRLDLATATPFNSTVNFFAGAADGGFAGAATLDAGTNANSVAAGDLNRDGKLDLAVTNQGGNTVGVMLGSGTGSFATSVNYPVGMTPAWSVVGDWNRDGRPDLAVTNQGTGTVSILLGVGDGTFGAATNLACGSVLGAVVAGDWNRDGRADLAVASGATSTIVIMLGVGDGTFQAAVPYLVGSMPGAAPFGVTTGDWNRDGKPDLASANRDGNSVSVLLGVGDGTFTVTANIDLGMTMGPVSISAGDLNRDGKTDLVAANNLSTTVSVLLGVGNGTFQAPLSVTVGTSPRVVAIGDWNRDGKPDLAVANRTSSNLSVLLNASR